MFSRSIALILTIFICLSTLSVQAQESQTFTLDQVIETAIRNNPQLKAAQARLGISEAEILTAGARLNPAIVSDNGIAEKTYRLGIEQTIELGGKRRKRINVANAQRQVVMAEVNTALLDLRSNVRRAYTQLFNAQEKERAYQDITQTTEKLLGITQKREQAGDIAKLDVLAARIARTSARNDFQTASYQVIEARSRLSALLNQPISSTIQLSPPSSFPQATLFKIPPMQGALLQGSVNEAAANLEELIAQALSHRPEVQELTRRQEVTQAQLALAKASRIPNLTLAAGPDYVSEPGQKEFNAFILGNLEIPLFNRQQGPIQEALAWQSQLEQERAALKNRITYEIINAHTAFVANQERIKRYETELIPDAQQVVEMSQLSFQAGKSSILIPIEAQRAYINTRLGYLQTLADYQNAISDLERAVGTGL